MRLRLVSLVVAATTFGAMNSVVAADLSVKATPYRAPAVVPVGNWTGFYIGVIGGYATGPVHADPTGILPAIGAYPIDFTAKGGFVGGQLGYDHQLANGVVLGVVGDIAWSRVKGSACAEVTPGRCDGDPRDSYASGTVNWLATVRAKTGLAVGSQGLLYATGGVAFAGTDAKDTFIDGVNHVTSSATHAGWALGAGGAYRLTRQVSFGLEYLYADLGKKSYTFNSANLGSGLAGLPMGIDASLKLNVFKGAINLHF
jgi:outer membrane immunogenic protein